MCITACFWVRVLAEGAMTSCALLHERTANIGRMEGWVYDNYLETGTVNAQL